MLYGCNSIHRNRFTARGGLAILQPSPPLLHRTSKVPLAPMDTPPSLQ
jgi:hypothetical protein